MSRRFTPNVYEQQDAFEDSSHRVGFTSYEAARRRSPADPLGRHGRIIPFRVEAAEIPSLLGQLAYLDLVGAGEDTARQLLTATLAKQDRPGALKVAVVGRNRRIVELENRNRSAMIEKVRTIWITGYLRQAMFQETRIISA